MLFPGFEYIVNFERIALNRCRIWKIFKAEVITLVSQKILLAELQTITFPVIYRNKPIFNVLSEFTSSGITRSKKVCLRRFAREYIRAASVCLQVSLDARASADCA